MKQSMLLIAFAIISSLLSGCMTFQDHRTIPTQLEDENIEIKSLIRIFKNDKLWKDANINVISFNNIVLIVGQTPTASLKEKASLEIKKVAQIKKIHNQIKVSAPIPFFIRRNDDFLTAKIKTVMLFTSDFSTERVKVVTENSEVYLMGIVNKKEAATAVKIARNVKGVKKVIKVFEYIK